MPVDEPTGSPFCSRRRPLRAGGAPRKSGNPGQVRFDQPGAKIPLIIGRILLQREDLRGALEASLQATKLDPDLLEAHQTALEVYRKLGRIEDAEKEAAIIKKLKARP